MPKWSKNENCSARRGTGTRIAEESVNRPKPMVEIGGMPILWHIMKSYSRYGYNDFIVCAGYKQHMIKEWFVNYFLRASDVTFDFSEGENALLVHENRCEPWKVTIVDTGLKTMTGGRIRRVRKYIGDEPFMLTYGDGVCDVDISALVKFHRAHGKSATLTAVVPEQQKGCLDIGENDSVRCFREKSAADASPINAGYMVLEPSVFELLDGDDCVFERGPLERLAAAGELKSFVHHGFWQCMDNIRERNLLEKLYAEGKAPWMP